MSHARHRGSGIAQVAFGLGLVAAAVYFAHRLDVFALEAALRRTSGPILGLVVGLNLTAALFHAGYWWVVLGPLGVSAGRDILRLTFAALAGNLIAPARAGDAFKVWQLKRVFGIEVPISMAAVGLEKLGEMLALLALVAPLPWLIPGLPAEPRRALELLVCGLGASLPLLWLGLRLLPPSKAPWLAALSFLKSPRPLALGFGSLLAAWILDLAQIWLLLSTLGLPRELAVALLVLLLVNLAIAIPLSVANVGTHELGSVAALTLVGVSPSDALIFALLYHATQTLPLVLIGLPDLRSLLSTQRWQKAAA